MPPYPGSIQPESEPTRPEATPDAIAGATAGPFGGPPPGSYAEGSFGESSSSSGSTADVAKEQASGVKDSAKEAGGQVVQEARQQAGHVAGEVRQQTGNLVQQGLSEIRNQTGQQQHRLAGTVHSWAHELGSMASSSDDSGPMTNFVQDASRRTGELAHWLENHEPRDILDELRSFARRRPGTFLLGAAAAGALVGRLTRGITAERSSGSSGSFDGGTTVGSPAHAYPETATFDTGSRWEPSSEPTAGTTPSGIGTAGIGTAGIGAGGAGYAEQDPGSPGVGTAGVGSADAGTGPLDTPPGGAGAGTATGTGVGPSYGGPGSAGAGIGPGGAGSGVSTPAPSGQVPPGGDDAPYLPPTPSER